MNIIVCIKQVPDVDDIKWTKDNNLDRTQMLSKINPADENALDWAIDIKSKFDDVNVVVVSMGPVGAKAELEYCLAKGATRAILLSDKAFIGSDTIITSKILSRAIKKYVPDYDLIITGQCAQDGDTGQVPISLAQMLDIPCANEVQEIVNSDKNCTIVSQKLDNKINIIELNTPCLVALNGECKNKPKIKINDYIKAQNTSIEVYNIEDLEFDKTEVGIMGSPTMVYRAYRPEIKKNAVEIKENPAKKLIELILRVE